MNRLQKVLARLKAHHGKANACLGDVRKALAQEGLKLPWRPYPWNTALANFQVLVKNPQKYGWKQVHGSLDTLGVVLVYFKRVGELPDGRVAGHISIYDPVTKTLYANRPYKMTDSWLKNLIGAFVPLE